MEDSAGLIRFYDRAYSAGGAAGEQYARWRRLGALGKADHVMALCRGAGIDPRSTLDVGCGDGALLGELAARGFGGKLHGAEISEPAARIAEALPAVESVVRFDGLALPLGDRSHDLGVLSHVLEHVPEPAALLNEVARVCRAVVVEVPLEANLSARRRAKRAHSRDIGHLHRLDRAGAREIVRAAGLRAAGELEDPLPLAVQRFFARGPRADAAAHARWALRVLLHRASPPLARRLFTLHYACLLVPRRVGAPPGG
ncbi:MAG: class I SAM-dependent methyltransferase [Solirubrobacteraceae bacterium]